MNFAMGDATAEKRYKDIRRCTYWSMAANFFITVMQLVIAPLSHSQSLLAHGVHSASDFISDILVLFATNHSQRPADIDHPYGHARLETLGVLVLGIVLLLVGLGFFYDVAITLYRREVLLPVTWHAAVAAGITYIGKEMVYRYLAHEGKRLHSPLVEANAWHSRVDALSALIVLVGVGGSFLGWPIVDRLAALVMGGVILYTSWGIIYQSLAELVDTGVTEESNQALSATILSTSGVLSLHDMRTRRMANRILLEVHLQVDRHLSVSEAHLIGEHAKERVVRAHEDVVDVVTHVDVETDAESQLPDEKQYAEIRQRLAAFHQHNGISEPRISLHCLHGQIEIELLYPAGVTFTDDQRQRLQDLQASLQYDFPSITRFVPYTELLV